MNRPKSNRNRPRTLSSRVSLSKTPADNNKSLSEQSPYLCTENDDDAEKRLRQKNKVLELRRRNVPSPLAAKQGSSSSLNGLTNSQITDHYKNCIKLSSENKITAKNAFGLHLIDYMSEMLQDRDEGMTNFQMASCTLDASTKIYAHRVDSVHADAYKIVGGLGQANKKSKNSNGINDENDGSDTESPGKKKKKGTKRSKTIVQNLSTINMKKLDERFDVDPLFKKMSATFDEGGVKSLLMNSLRSRDDFCELLLDSSSNFISSDITTESSSQILPTSDFKFLSDIDWNSQICPQFSEFQFRNWRAGVHDIYGNDSSNKCDGDVDCKSTSNHAFDMNAVPEPVEDDESPKFCDTVFGDGFPDHDDDDDEAEEPEVEKNKLGLRFDTVDALTQLLSDKPSDYSYFDTRLLSAWAGPNHWRIRPFSKVHQENKEKKEQKKKDPVVIDYDEHLDIDKLFKNSSKVSKRLGKKTLQQWSVDKTTVPEDLHYDVSSLMQLFLKPNIKLKLSKQTTEVDDGVRGYNYNNANDCENFCPPSQENDNSDIGCDGGFDNDFNISMNNDADNNLNSSINPSGDVVGFSADNLLQQPYRVAKVNINYARTAKKVDVHKLKSKMWNIMVENNDESNKENVNTNQSISSEIQGETTFSSLYQTLSEKLPSVMSQNLSVHLTFVCFLHLVNEKCLKLDSLEDMTDFKITQDY